MSDPEDPGQRGERPEESEGLLDTAMRLLLGRTEGSGAPADRQPEEGRTTDSEPDGADPVFRVDLTRVEGGPAEAPREEAPEEARAPGETSVGTMVTPRPEEEAGVEAPPEEEGRPSLDPQVLADLQHHSADVRGEALDRLLREPAAAPIVAVTARLRDPEPRIRELAVAVLEAGEDERGLMLLLPAVEDPAEEVRRRVREAFAKRRSDSLVSALRRELSVPASRRRAAMVLAELREVDALAEAASGADSSVRETIREAIDAAGLSDQLISDLEDARADRRGLAAERLGAMRIREAVTALTERLADPDTGVRTKAAEALGLIAAPAATHALKRSLIWDPEMTVVVAVGRALRQIAGASERSES